MAERPTTAELEMWRVEGLPDDFADRVLARMDEGIAFDEDTMVPLTDPDEAYVHVTPTPLPRARWAGAIALVCAAAAMLGLWLLRPVPPAPPPSSPPPRLAVSIAEPVLPAAHGLDREALRRTLTEQLLPHVRLCHEWLAINTTFASGQIVLELDVERRDGRGVVTRAAFDPISELENPVFRDCILERARLVTFAAPPAGPPVEIVVPLELHDPWTSNYDAPAE